jgi:hypothetical protein
MKISNHIFIEKQKRNKEYNKKLLEIIIHTKSIIPHLKDRSEFINLLSYLQNGFTLILYQSNLKNTVDYIFDLLKIGKLYVTCEELELFQLYDSILEYTKDFQKNDIYTDDDDDDDDDDECDDNDYMYWKGLINNTELNKIYVLNL